MPEPGRIRLIAARSFKTGLAARTALSVFCTLLLCGCLQSTVGFPPREIDGADWEEAMRDDERQTAPDSSDSPRVIIIARSYLGTSYRYGGMSKQGTDCSGLVCQVFRALNGAELPHSSKELAALGRRIPLRRARPGDLLFFRREFQGRTGHVGIYLGNNRFVHASSAFGVIESSMNDEYYRKHFIQARRIFP